MELVDRLDLDSNGISVRVRVPSQSPVNESLQICGYGGHRISLINTTYCTMIGWLNKGISKYAGVAKLVNALD